MSSFYTHKRRLEGNERFNIVVQYDEYNDKLGKEWINFPLQFFYQECVLKKCSNETILTIEIGAINIKKSSKQY